MLRLNRAEITTVASSRNTSWTMRGGIVLRLQDRRRMAAGAAPAPPSAWT